MENKQTKQKKNHYFGTRNNSDVMNWVADIVDLSCCYWRLIKRFKFASSDF